MTFLSIEPKATLELMVSLNWKHWPLLHILLTLNKHNLSLSPTLLMNSFFYPLSHFNLFNFIMSFPTRKKAKPSSKMPGLFSVTILLSYSFSALDQLPLICSTRDINVFSPYSKLFSTPSPYKKLSTSSPCTVLSALKLSPPPFPIHQAWHHLKNWLPPS